MKISDIRCQPLYGTADPETWMARYGTRENCHSIVVIETDGGLRGAGSAYTSTPLVTAAIALLRPLVIGQDPCQPGRVTEDLHQATFWQGFGGTVTHTLSAVNIALWDLFGQATGTSISRLLGGRYRERVRPYGSMIMSTPEETARRIEAARARGFQAFKLGWGPFGRRSRQLDRDIVAAARRAAGDGQLMIDAGGSEQYWGNRRKWALDCAHMLAEFGVRWFEEPLEPDDREGYRWLTERSPVPIAGGEVLTRRQNFTPWLAERCLDVIQPDVTKNGGISESIRIGHLAEAFGVTLIGHGWNTAFGLYADLQVAAALPHTDLVEYMTPNEYIDDLVLGGVRLDGEGFLAIPDAPGLGARWNWPHIERLGRG
jgi:L-alanine-DL-glutamate epimerase-like enolase superfamily enzyme